MYELVVCRLLRTNSTWGVVFKTPQVNDNRHDRATIRNGSRSQERTVVLYIDPQFFPLDSLLVLSFQLGYYNDLKCTL